MSRRLRSPRLRARGTPACTIDGAAQVEISVWMLVAAILLQVFAEGGAPRATAGLDPPRVVAGGPVTEGGPVVAITADGGVRVDGAWLCGGAGAPAAPCPSGQVPALRERLAAIRHTHRLVAADAAQPFDGIVYVAGDARADSAAVRAAVDAARAAGWPRVALLGWRR